VTRADDGNGGKREADWEKKRGRLRDDDVILGIRGWRKTV